METYFPNHRKHKIALRWKEWKYYIRETRYYMFYFEMRGEKKLYLESDKDYKKMILSILLIVVCWLLLLYFTPYEAVISKVLVMIMGVIFLYYAFKIGLPVIKISENEIEFRTFSLKWEEMERVGVKRIGENLQNPQKCNFKIEILTKKGETFEKYFEEIDIFRYYEFRDYIKSFRRGYRRKKLFL